MSKRESYIDLSEDFKVHAVKPEGLRRWLQAFGSTGFGMELPRRGVHLGNGEIRVPHILRRATREHVDSIEGGIGVGDSVIVYSKGRTMKQS